MSLVPLVLLSVLGVALADRAAAQDPAQVPARQLMMEQLVEHFESATVDHAEFVSTYVAPALVERASQAALMRTVGQIHAAVHPGDLDELRPESTDLLVLIYRTPSAEVELRARMAADGTVTLADLWIVDGIGLDAAADHAGPAPLEPIGWDNLAERLEEESAWFSGVLLVVRDGEVVLNQGYGMANREKQIANTPETIFAVGSTPIDFTKAGILLLMEAGEVTSGSLLSDFFDGVPEDKQGITIGHLMTGGSGLQDFLGLPTDSNLDHFYIDREEAQRRIFAQQLLFAPGTQSEHSHAAWGLLAAVIEIVSGQSYAEFVTQNLFEPAGMQDTGFFGVSYPEQRMAVGYGYDTSGEINAPPYWGPTSWLVMGSGGMVSTTGDMLRWFEGLRSGELLNAASLGRYWSPPGSLLAAGDMFGFEMRYTEGPAAQMIMISNAGDSANRRRIDELAELLSKLTAQAARGAAAK